MERKKTWGKRNYKRVGLLGFDCGRAMLEIPTVEVTVSGRQWGMCMFKDENSDLCMRGKFWS